MTKKKLPNFRDDLEFGQACERFFLDQYGDYIKPYHNTDSDMEFISTGRRIELKSDRYKLGPGFSAKDKTTENFFLERWIHPPKHTGKPKTPGGIWQALDAGSDILIYYFQKPNMFYWFDDIQILVHQVERIIQETKLHLAPPVYNAGGFHAGGWKVPIEWLESLYVRPYRFGDARPFKCEDAPLWCRQRPRKKK